MLSLILLYNIMEGRVDTTSKLTWEIPVKHGRAVRFEGLKGDEGGWARRY